MRISHPMPTKVLIGIQARSTSERFPNKHHEFIDGKMIINHVIQKCTAAMYYANSNFRKLGVECKTALLTPYDDPLGYGVGKQVPVVYGPEDDVLTRYVMAANEYEADFIVRITGDCPIIPSHIISRHILIAVKHQYDYASNVFEAVRTAPDGYDCEIMSRRMLDWLDTEAKTPEMREHVTLLARSPHAPKWAKMCAMVGYLDVSHIKISVDTKADLERVEEEYLKVESKHKLAVKIYGTDNVERY